MAETTLNHRGHRIVIGGTEDAPTVSIDGQSFPVNRIRPGLYSTLILPQTNFTSLDAVARALVDHLHQFRQPGSTE